MSPDSVLRSRRDVDWQRLHARSSDGERRWTAFDPLTRATYRCGDAEQWLFHQFDGRRSLREICNACLTQPSLQRIGPSELSNLARMLIGRGLVQRVDENAAARAATSNNAPERSWLQWFTQSVSWRMRGIDPHRWLLWLAPHTDFIFSLKAVRVWFVIASFVLLIVLANFSRLIEQATLWQWLMQPANGTSLFAIFIITRGLHELGHALTLTRLGGRCPDIGLIFMLGAPCVYCDVSESWRLPSAKQRAAVAAGGMYAEVIVATLAAIIWLATTDGTTNTLALQTMIVCSISTCMININPLMRFDGYYILSDWLDAPNLRTRADQSLLAYLQRLLLGASAGVEHVRLEWRRVGLALFSLAGCLYRMSLSWMMATVIVSLYTAWNLAWFGRIFALLLLFTWWVIPAMKLAHSLFIAAGSRWARFRLAALAAWMVVMICAIPLPSRQFGKGWVQPVRMQGLFAPAPATLRNVHKHSGDYVEAGQVVFQLADTEPKLRAVQMSHAAEKARVQLVSLRRQRYYVEPSQLDLQALESAAEGTQRQVAHAQAAVERLAVRATMAGKLISLPAPALLDLENRSLAVDPQLWLESQQIGRQVPAGAMLGAICSHEQIAVIPLEDSQLHAICTGTKVRLQLAALGPHVWTSQVSAVVRLDQLDSVTRLMTESEQPSGPTASDGKPLKPTHNAGYAAIVPLNCENADVNAEIRAVFSVPAKTVAARANDWLRANIRWLMP